MKKILALTLCLVLSLSLFSGCSSEGDSDSVTINVYNWGQYIADGSDDSIDINAEFTKRTGIKVNYTTYDTNESLYAKLKTGGSSYDVIIPSDYMIAQMIAEDMLEKLNYDNIPNLKNIDARFLNPAYDPTNGYSVPYTWGTVGLVYNTKFITKPVDSWGALWDPDFKGKILMFENARDAFGIGALLLGRDINPTSQDDINAIADKLKEQRPLVQQYVMDQIFDSMVSGEAWIAPYYAGDCLYMMNDNPDLAFVRPKEGFNYFVDGICIPKGAKHKEAAEAYINFLCDPEISGQNMDYLGYSTPISAARDFLSEEVANSDIAYPDEATVDNGGKPFIFVSSDNAKAINDKWLTVRADA